MPEHSSLRYPARKVRKLDAEGDDVSDYEYRGANDDIDSEVEVEIQDEALTRHRSVSPAHCHFIADERSVLRELHTRTCGCIA